MDYEMLKATSLMSPITVEVLQQRGWDGWRVVSVCWFENGTIQSALLEKSRGAFWQDTQPRPGGQEMTPEAAQRLAGEIASSSVFHGGVGVL